MTEKVYRSPVTAEQLISYIEGKREELIRGRETELDGLADMLSDFPVVNCGVRNDKVDDIIKAFVRNKSLKSAEALTKELDGVVLERIRQYCLWSYYNQTANDIAELFFLKHPRVIPTLRKIHDIDFFLKTGNAVIPFDLKFTHISDSYFDMASRGIIRDTDPAHHDDFLVDGASDASEINVIKSFYKALKSKRRDLCLPNYGGFDKNDLCEHLLATKDEEAIQFVGKMKRNHKNHVPSSPETLYPLEWWNYKYQG